MLIRNFGVLTLMNALLACPSMAKDSSNLIEFENEADHRAEYAAPVTIRLNDGQLVTRYRYQTDGVGGVAHNTVQDRILFDVSVLFFDGKVRLDIEGSTGTTFDGSFNGTGLGTGDPVVAAYLRRLSIALSPLSGLELSLGSMAPVYGAGTENSSFDADAYIVGYRAKVALDKGDIVVTTGYVGDFENPNVFDRFTRMDEANYLQLIITRSIGDLVKTSLEYSILDGEDYARGAVKIDVSKWVSFVDAVTFEDMTRLDQDDLATVFAARISKRFAGLVKGRDLNVDLSYVYRSDEMDLKIGDKVFLGHQVRATLACPNVAKIGPAKLGIYIDVIESLSDFDLFRGETGLMLKF